MSKRTVVSLLLVLLGGVGLYAAAVVVRAHFGLAKGEKLLAHQLFPQAREHFVRYLRLHPGDARVRMLMAEALVKDETLYPEDAASQAISYLAQIHDSSPLAAEARLQQGRLCLLILQKPSRAERLLRTAIKLGEDDLAAYRLLWTVLNITGRSESTEQVFWHVYELSPERERPRQLREWYMQQFAPTTANESLDRMMGVLAPGEVASPTTESRRYLRFRENEPEAPVTHASLAQWCHQEGDPSFAVQLLDAAAKALPSWQSDPFFLAVTVGVKLDLGQFEEAESCFRRWPKQDRGYLYWKSRAVVLDDVTGQHEAALEAYDRAIDLWPGPVEWRLQFRRAGCLARLKRPQEAAQARMQAEGVQALMTPQVHQRLRQALRVLDDPDQLAETIPLTEIVQFYRGLGRDREANCWKEYIQRLQ